MTRDYLRTHAIVLVVNNRYYFGHSSTGRMQTAWALAGAKLFQDGADEVKISQAEQMMIARGYRPYRATIGVVSRAEPRRWRS